MPRHLRLVVSIGVAALVCLPAPASAQRPLVVPDLAPYVGRTVMVLRVEVEGQPTHESSLLRLLEVHESAPLREAEVRESLAHLTNLRRFSDVTVAVRPSGGGVDVIFTLTPAHPIDRLEFRGTLGIGRRDLERGVREQIGGRLATLEPDVAVAAVRRLLGDEGFAAPVVRAEIESSHAAHRSTLVLTIEAGPRQRVGRITIAGASPLSAGEVRTSLGVMTGQPYRRRALEDTLRGVAERLRARGYYEASASHFAAGEGQVVDLVVSVEAGPIVEIVVTGDSLPTDDVDQWIPIRRENSADQDLLEDAAIRIQAALQRDGYWRAKVNVRPLEDPDGSRIVVSVEVNRGRQYRLRDVTIAGHEYFSEDEVRALLDLRLGEFFRLDVVTNRVVALYNAYEFAGFAADITIVPEAATDTRADQDGEAVVHLSIIEGPARSVGDVVVQGAEHIGEAEVRRAIRLAPGQPLRDAQIRQDRDAVELLYRNSGLQSAEVTVTLDGGPQYTVTFVIVEGRQTTIDHVIVAGNRRVDTQTILNQVTLRSGQPFGLAARLESLRQLNALAIFRRVSITGAPGGTDETHVDVVVQVEEAAATTVGYGGGVEFGRRLRTVSGVVEERLEFAPRGFLELGRRNLFGGNRSINLFSRVSLRKGAAGGAGDGDGDGFGFSEYRVTGIYREGRAWRSATDLVVSATTERTIRTSYTFERRGINAEALRRWSARTSVFARYALDSTRLFENGISADDQPLIDRLFPQIRLSSVSSGVVWDNRNDLLDPTGGGLLSADAEVAARGLGSEVGFVKAFFQATGFRRVSRGNRVVLAGRMQVGLARGFERQVVRLDASGQPVGEVNGESVTDTVADLPAGRRFFAGGSTSVRGFQQDRLGVPDIINVAGLSIGGNGLVVLNGEARMRIVPSVSLVAFVDAGNVFARAGDIRLAQLRATLGAGIRYRSPLGPLRLDVGFKGDRRLVGGKRERGWEFHLSIGEAF